MRKLLTRGNRSVLFGHTVADEEKGFLSAPEDYRGDKHTVVYNAQRVLTKFCG